MNKNITKFFAFAVVMALVLVMIPQPALAAPSPKTTLYDTGSALVYEYRVQVFINESFCVDKDEITLAVSVSPFASTVTDAKIDGWFLNIQINDGTINKTVANFTLTSLAAKVTWQNVTIYGGDFVANSTSDMWIVLMTDAHAVEDSAKVELAIYASEVSGLFSMMIPVFITLGVVSIIAVGIRKRFA